MMLNWVECPSPNYTGAHHSVIQSGMGVYFTAHTNWLNGKLHGHQVVYHPNGAMESDSWYHKGALHGKHKEWFSTGQNSYEFDYFHGRKHGEALSWYLDGTPHYKKNYKYGELHGKYEEWFSNGVKMVDVVYVRGKRSGKCTSWTFDGGVHSETNYKNDKFDGQCVFYNSNGTVWISANYKDGKYHGEVVHNDSNGRVFYRCNYSNGKRHGLVEEWHANGDVKSSEEYVMGYPKKGCVKMLYLLRKLKWLRLSRFTKTREFNEWWYNPQNTGGKISKRKIEHCLVETNNKRQHTE